jgi:hypothetical protein
MSYGNAPQASSQKGPVVQIADEWGASEKVMPFDSTEHDEKLFDELLVKYNAAVRTADAFESATITPRKNLMGKWMREGDLGFVFGERGSGKTWFVDALTTHISTGRDLHGWDVPDAVDVLYVDGEMPGDDARDRIKGMSTKGNQRLHILHHELLFDSCGLAMNLTQPLQQRVITALCIQKNVKLLTLDNLSCLFYGMAENDADAWEKVLNWLLDLRRRHIAVLIVHHASRSGTMRGTSRREDAAFWIVEVKPKINHDNGEGAHFETNFLKQRNCSTREFSREWTFKTEITGDVSIGCTEVSLETKVFELIKDGLTSPTDISGELGLAKSTVSRIAQRLVDQRAVINNGRKGGYVVAPVN